MTGKVLTNPAGGESISVDGITLDSAYAGFSRGKVTNNERTSPGNGYTVAYHSNVGRVKKIRVLLFG
jgi:hypothetical protein